MGIAVQTIRSCKAVTLVHTKDGRATPFADVGPLSLPISQTPLITAGGLS